MVDYEKGSPSWDIGQIVTRHASDPRVGICAKVLSLQATRGDSPTARLIAAHKVACNCGAGDSMSEHTTDRRSQWISSDLTPGIHP
jgi:hypothetical protein